MIKNVDPNAVVRFTNLDKHAGSKGGIEIKSVAASVSDKIEISNEAKTTSQTSQYNRKAALETPQRSKIFSDVFLANFKTLGIQAAFDLATSASRSAFSVDGSFLESSSEEPDDPIEKILEEYNTGATSRADDPDDAAATEARRKMTAMKIAMRISKGDNVPMQDHRFLAEYDANLYKSALKASLTAENDDPETHDSLAEEMLAAESATANRRGESSGMDENGTSGQSQEVTIDSVDTYY